MYTQIIQKPANIIKFAAFDFIFNGKPAELEQTCWG